jgi:hypothetical protein
VTRRALRGVFFAAGTAALLVALYALLGTLLAPSVMRRALVERAAQAGFELRLGAIATHPFSVAVDARDVALAARSGERLLNARRVTVQLEIASLWRPAWLLRRVALEEPTLYALPARLAATETQSAMPPVIVQELTVERGIVALPALPHVDALQLSVRDLATLPGHDNAYSAAAAITGGGSARTQGRLSLAPFAASGELDVKQVALAEAWRAVAVGGDLPAGEVTGSFHYRYAEGRLALSQVDAQATLRSGGAVALRGALATSPLDGELELAAKAVPLALVEPWVAGKPGIRIGAGTLAAQGTLHLGAKPYFEGSAAIHDARIDGPQGELMGWRSLAAANLRLDFAPFAARTRELVAQGPLVHVVIGPQGELNIARAFAGGEPSATKGEPPQISVDRLTVQAGELEFEDRSLQTPFATTVHDLAGAITGLATARAPEPWSGSAICLPGSCRRSCFSASGTSSRGA